jgi:hypothetical protein
MHVLQTPHGDVPQPFTRGIHKARCTQDETSPVPQAHSEPGYVLASPTKIDAANYFRFQPIAIRPI